MVELSQLWLPILLSGVAVFFLSFLMWMVLPHHRSDWTKLPDEDGLMARLKEMGVTSPGQYSFPHCSDPAQMKDPVWMARHNAGPKGFLILQPEGPASMGKALAVSFVFNVVTALLVAYVARLALAPGTEGAFVFRFTWMVAFLANSFGLVWGAIWFARSWTSTFKEMIDGLVYSAATGLLFMALWPAAA
jgi:hypothetical protein